MPGSLFSDRFGQDFLRNDAGGDDRERQAAGEVAAAARIVEAAVFDIRRVVRMARAGRRAKQRIISGMRIRIGKRDGQRGAGRMALEDTAADQREVGFPARGRAFGTAPAPGQVRGEIRLRQGDPRLHAVNHHPDLGAV